MVFDEDRKHLLLYSVEVGEAEAETDFGKVVTDPPAKREPALARQPAVNVDELIFRGARCGLNETSAVAEAGDVSVARTVLAQSPVTRQRGFDALSVSSIIHVRTSVRFPRGNSNRVSWAARKAKDAR